ncbi:hypothetical protein LOK74_06275 [Brevibacillus humidisoli]|uniref:hypothetical protein n=1 Tax=Brevibacillus humidisoli TaxID=2895522 RepID=UPI001E3C6A8A|nr:hypothetical protein [Brevibacillus humidisoli]UFJ42100.1 hypothetical protein LOK74_06275 [Brevibacillus humidisoli]
MHEQQPEAVEGAAESEKLIGLMEMVNAKGDVGEIRDVFHRTEETVEEKQGT